MLHALDILKDLNKEQIEVVKNINGSYFVLSGPGSGKTKCLVSRTQYMLRNGILPESIVLFTFTIKAANEIKERIKAVIDPSIADKLTIGTYHSVCLRILKAHIDAVPVINKNFTIYDQSDSFSILKKICSETAVEVREAVNYISDKKDHLISYQDAILEAESPYEKKKAEIYSIYQQHLIKNNAMDFDDIIFYTVQMLENHQKIRQKLNERYRYIVSDETQDASTSNLRLLELLGFGNNVCMFLDDDQSIYGFRGADVTAVLQSTVKFPNMRTLHLNRNYRSTQTIVNASVDVINHNINRKEKELFTQNDSGVKIMYYTKYNKDQEATNVYNLVKYLTKKGLSYNEIAVLYRNNALSKSVESAFLKGSIPYTIKNSISFFERKEVKDIIAYVRFITNPYDDEAFKRIINIPKRGIGPATIADIEAYVDENKGKNILECCNKIIDEKIVLSKGAINRLKPFIELISDLHEQSEVYLPADLVKEIINRINYIEVLKHDNAESWPDKYLNVMEIIDLAQQYMDIQDFLRSVMCAPEHDASSSEEKVTLSTIHGCKGLEWKAVIIIGLNDDILPGRSNEEEERRLFYVAMTRAKEYLFMSRFMFDQSKPDAAKECRFIREIPSEYIVKNK